MLSKDTVPCDNVSSSSEPSSSSSASATASSPSLKRTTLGDTEQDHSKLPEPLSVGTWDFSGDPVLDSLPEPDPDELEPSEPDVLPEALPDPELEPEEEELDLEP